ncbi:RNA polymerase sigma-70 factor [Flavitalea flava]
MIENYKGILQTPGQSREDLFEQVFKSHFKNLHAYASTLIKDPASGEEVVQNVFLRLWEKKDNMDMLENIAAYLYRAVHNESLNYLKHLKVKSAYQSFAMRRPPPNNPEQASEKIKLGELESRLGKALNDLPEQCRTIFQLSRFEELKYREIADRLGLSVKTVENQMGKALKILRLKMVDFLPFITLIITTLLK